MWGRIRGAVTASQANAQASAADLEAVRLSLHAELAADYFTLRGIDRDRELLDAAVESFEKALELTQNRFQGGIASQADVAQAETALETTRAQAVDVPSRAPRSSMPSPSSSASRPSAFTIAAAPMPTPPPACRRPCRQSCSSGGQTSRPPSGASPPRTRRSAWRPPPSFPRLMLSGAAGFESSPLGSLLRGTSSFWTIGPHCW